MRPPCFIASLCLTMLLLWSQVAPAQAVGKARLDSLLMELPAMREDTNGVLLLAAIADECQRIDPAEGVAYGDKALAVASRIGWRKGEQLAYSVLGTSHLYRDSFAPALDACFHALNIAEERKDYKALSQILGNISMVHMVTAGIRDQALQYGFQSLRLAKQTNDKRCIAYALANIARVYVHSFRPAEALKYELKALAMAEQLRDPAMLTEVYGTLSVIYSNLHQKNLELRYAFKALRLAEVTGNIVAVARNAGNIGGSYVYISQDTTADSHPDSLVSADRRHNLEQGIKYLSRAIPLAMRLRAYDRAITYKGGLAFAFFLTGDYKAAFETMVSERNLKDSIYIANNVQNLEKLETARALQLRDKDLQIAKLAVAKKRNERAFYIAGIALLLIILGILTYSFRRHDRARRRIKALQDHKISLLDKAVRQRTEQLHSMRQTVATDFHDQTGNMLAAINRQAAILEMKLHANPELLPLVQSITANSNELYASSKDFLWNLNNNSDNPLTLFQYLTAYGQHFSNQFDIAFSAQVAGEPQEAEQLSPFAALNLIYIFKEAMSNVIRHSGADEVTMTMAFEAGRVVYTLTDNGQWKEATPGEPHYGLDNMERRCRQSGFGYERSHDAAGTRIAVSLPLTAYFIHNDTP